MTDRIEMKSVVDLLYRIVEAGCINNFEKIDAAYPILSAGHTNT